MDASEDQDHRARYSTTDLVSKMSDDPIEYRFYGELAEWWRLISPPDEYAEEAEFVRTLLRSAAIPVREVLEVGQWRRSHRRSP